jgi:hypothetical protein
MVDEYKTFLICNWRTKVELEKRQLNSLLFDAHNFGIHPISFNELNGSITKSKECGDPCA